MNVIITNNDEFTQVCSSIEAAYNALCEAYDRLADNHIHIEFCNVNKVGNNESANYSAIIDHKYVTRY